MSRGGMNSTLISVRGGGVLAYYCARAMTSAAGASMSSTTSTANGAPAPYERRCVVIGGIVLAHDGDEDLNLPALEACVVVYA